MHNADRHEEVISGRRKAWAWGLSGNLPYLLLQSPYRFEGVIDGQSSGRNALSNVAGLPVYGADKLKDLNPADTLIVVFADLKLHGSAIFDQARRYGPFDLVAPHIPALHDVPAALQARTQRLGEMLIEKRHDTRYTAVPKRVALWLHGLVKGGAERQMVLLACGLRELGWDVDLICTAKDSSQTTLWADELRDAGVNRMYLPDMRASWDWLESESGVPEQVPTLAPYFTTRGLHDILQTVDILLERRPELVISFLDDGNIAAGVASVLAGVPNILMSGRNAEPHHFTDLQYFPVAKSQLKSCYQALLSLDGVALVNNSQAGAESYSQWLGLPDEAIEAIPNAVQAPTGQMVSSIREQYGIAAGVPLVLGVMRLADEKQPLRFVDMITRLKTKLPELQAILLGDGPLYEDVRQAIDSSALQSSLIMAGAQESSLPYLAEADLLLSTSRMEGMPNVILEAQLMACPVVATNVGGVAEALMSEMKVGLVSKDDWMTMEKVALNLLLQKSGAKDIAKKARAAIIVSRSVQELARRYIDAGLGRKNI
ncbi:glycosyltransferase [Marinobacterium sp. D7]|uniref:glycosyltransferase n=1 Tax=Marinobacterium ramblicola TaxID=2849041 RepID=UPI001C2D5F81|nr:glycosyltransferase [Marinobacterium ramblicola]MBV1788888.1 glycosyltransferase [Marinobacterium ramblicola]